MATQRVIITYVNGSVVESDMNPEELIELLNSGEKDSIKISEIKILIYSGSPNQ